MHQVLGLAVAQKISQLHAWTGSGKSLLAPQCCVDRLTRVFFGPHCAKTGRGKCRLRPANEGLPGHFRHRLRGNFVEQYTFNGPERDGATQLRISRQNTQLGAEAGFVILGGAGVSIARTDHAEGIGVGNTLRLQRQTATQGIAQVTAFGLTGQGGGYAILHQLKVGSLIACG